MSWEYDFVSLAAEIFELFVLGVLPVVAIVIVIVYMNRIIRVWVETHRVKLQVRSKRRK